MHNDIQLSGSPTLNSYGVSRWDVREEKLSDGSTVYDVIGSSQEGRCVIHCITKRDAFALHSALCQHAIGAAVERI